MKRNHENVEDKCEIIKERVFNPGNDVSFGLSSSFESNLYWPIFVIASKFEGTGSAERAVSGRQSSAGRPGLPPGPTRLWNEN